MKTTQNQGFTLIEMMTVVAITATLVTLVFSGVQSSMGRAHQVACMSNLRQLHLANTLYATDHGSYVPAASDMQGPNLHRWHGVRRNQQEPFDGSEGPLVDYLGQDRRIRRCAAFRPDPSSSNPFEASCGGYGYNAVGIGSRTYVAASRAEAQIRGMRINQLASPSTTIMFSDTAFPQPYQQPDHMIEYSFAEAYHFVMRTPSGNLQKYGPAMPSIHFRHRDHANVAWADGGVSSTKMETSYSDAFSTFQVGWPGGPNNDYFRPF